MQRRPLLALSAALFTVFLATASSSPALAERNHKRVSTIVDRDVTFLTTAVFDGIRYRAIVLESHGSSDLVIEMEDTDRRGRRMLVAQVWLHKLSFDRRDIDSLNANDFRNIQFGRGGLRFETTLRRGEVLCRIPIRRFDPRDRSIDADCQLMNAQYPVATPIPHMDLHPHPQPPMRPGRDRDHNHAHQDDPRRGPRALPSDFQPRLIQACQNATIGNSSFQSCVSRGQTIGFFAPEAVAACGQATIGNSSFDECLGSVQVDSPWTAAIIGACSDATIGNSAINACVRIATAATVDPIPTIRSCNDATIGSQAFQRCIASSVR